MKVYFLLHEFIYGWDVAQFTDDEEGRTVVYTTTDKEELKADIEEEPEDERDGWMIAEGTFSSCGKHLLTEEEIYDYFQFS